MTDADQPPRNSGLPPGYDEDDPYEDEDLDEYPEWWRRNIEKFREHGMRPYRPPRFEDGELIPEVIADLEEEIGEQLQLRAHNPEVHADWGIWLGDKHVGTIGRERSGDGYTLYKMDSSQFGDLIRNASEE